MADANAVLPGTAAAEKPPSIDVKTHTPGPIPPPVGTAGMIRVEGHGTAEAFLATQQAQQAGKKVL
jgi:hypothetical protein